MGTSTNLSAAGGVVLGVLCLLTTVSTGLSRPAAAGLVGTVASVLSLEVFDVLTVAGLAAQLLAAYRLGRSESLLSRSPGGRGPRILALAMAVPYLVLALVAPGQGEARVLIVLLAALTPVAALAGVARRREAEVAGAAEQAIAGSLFEHMARGERARIARELHDVVAHHISMVSVQAETARLTVPGMPDEGARRLSEIGDTARAGLTEMRRLLGVLREDAASVSSAPAVLAGAGLAMATSAAPAAAPAPASASRHPQPGLAQLNELLDEGRDASGSAIRLIVSGPVATLDPGVELAVYRIVQEALTNARRHAPGAAVDVELRFGSEVLLVRIRDNGPGTDPMPASAPGRAGLAPDGAAALVIGHGLLGMRERAQAAAGELRAGPAEGGGFLVQATLPVQAAGPSRGSSGPGPVAAGSAA
jgi:signal transduction histidine kinase